MAIVSIVVLRRRGPRALLKAKIRNKGTLICVGYGSYDKWNLMTLFESVDKDGTIMMPYLTHTVQLCLR